ncbi:class I SAM-dependent methyltransferase [Sporichthya polymorpha]|uniref:class I SAM-dependent methyltransferase n=1 Tax=Sporichthya polymorpha TaxID=35751 RepID=UPI00036E66F0|nr:class I SAM-dependent methyltransferase [Sporichthya polymorpha]
MTGPRPSPAGDVDYEVAGAGYGAARRADPRIAAHVHAALGDARTVLNVGAGSGNYEPADRAVIAVEPSAAMRAQRPRTALPAVDATAEHLPFDDDSVDAAMATITVHQWADLARGLAELRRVARGPVVVLTFDPDAFAQYWLIGYGAELAAGDRARMPDPAAILDALGGRGSVQSVPIPRDCTDGFVEAYFGRPAAYLDPAVRDAQSVWRFVAPDVTARIVADLAADLASGAWDVRFGRLRTADSFDGSLRLVVAEPPRA